METGIQFTVHFDPPCLLVLGGTPQAHTRSLHGYYQQHWTQVSYSRKQNDNDGYSRSSARKSGCCSPGRVLLLLRLSQLLSGCTPDGGGCCCCWMGYLHSGSHNRVLVLAAHYFICHHLLYSFYSNHLTARRIFSEIYLSH